MSSRQNFIDRSMDTAISRTISRFINVQISENDALNLAESTINQIARSHFYSLETISRESERFINASSGITFADETTGNPLSLITNIHIELHRCITEVKQAIQSDDNAITPMPFMLAVCLQIITNAAFMSMVSREIK